jgi:nucleotide-binding universal stress UspA family protein
VAARARNILVGYDGSEASRRALEVAADLAGYGSMLAVVSVVREHDDDAVNGVRSAEPRGASALDEAREHLLRRHVSARYLEPFGEPAEKLIEAAQELDTDLIVVGRRDRNRLQQLLPGSVSSKVVRGAPCDVLVVR